MFSKTHKMIKLSFHFDVSFGKVIFGAAGISATICAFQYFTTNKIKLKGPSKNDVVENKSNSKKNNKVSNTVPEKVTVESEFSKNKSAFNDLQNSNNSIVKDKLPLKSKGCINTSIKVLRKRSDCIGECNSNFKRSVSISDLNYEDSVSENKPYKANINKEIPGQLPKESVKVHNNQLSLRSNETTCHDSLQAVGEKTKMGIKKDELTTGTL